MLAKQRGRCRVMGWWEVCLDARFTSRLIHLLSPQNPSLNLPVAQVFPLSLPLSFLPLFFLRQGLTLEFKQVLSTQQCRVLASHTLEMYGGATMTSLRVWSPVSPPVSADVK